MRKENFPIIVGAAQYTQHKGTTQPLDPLSLIVKVSQEALDDTGADRLKEFIDSIYMVNINSWSYEDAPGELSKILGIKPIQKIYLPDGGDSPQMLMNRAAKAITRGESQAILITGGEASYSKHRAKAGKITLNWPKREEPKYMEGKLWYGTSEFENKYGMPSPSFSYALFETAIRAASDRTLEEHARHMGRLFEHFSKSASKNPYAWTQKFYTAEEITSPNSENRNIIYPYTKRMCSNMYVDQSGALIMTSEETAEKLEIDEKYWVYPMGGADIKNIFNITQRPRLHDSPAARKGSRLALKQAGLKFEDIDLFDIYCCFPSIVEIIKSELGFSEDYPHNLTITGGLPYFGGPWSNYSTHAIVSAVGLIRKNPMLKIMVVANGGYNTKQSFGIYGNEPPVISWDNRDDTAIQEKILAESLPEPIEKANGQLTIEAYTFYYDRSGKLTRGIVVGKLIDERRTIAFIQARPNILSKLEQQELVGKKFKVQYDSKIDRNLIILPNYN